MLHILPRPGGRKVTADPDQGRLKITTVVEFDARSSHSQGENATVAYAVNEDSGVLIAKDGTQGARIEVPHFVDGGRTPIRDTLELVAAPNRKPCGLLPITVFLCPKGSKKSQDRGLVHVDIDCT